MVSRLDRLFILLDTGSNDSIRFAAAKQLGEVQRVQPNDLDYLLQRIKEYSGKSVWETRVAAGQATRCVLEQVDRWPLLDGKNFNDDKCVYQLQIRAEKLIEDEVDTIKLLQEFDLEQIVAQCPKLLSLDVADVDEPNLANPSCSKTPTRGKSRKESTSKASLRKREQERLMLQRKLINKELGIPMVLNLGVQSTDIVSNDDLQANYESNDQSEQQDNRRIIATLIKYYDRVIDLLRDKDLITCDEHLERSNIPASSSADQSNNKSSHEWPLLRITASYTNDLFHPSWEIRHGAAISLREIVRLQGSSAGKRDDLSPRANDIMNQLWLVDMALRAISVLVLDKFGDFLFDQVVAPVRENAAQLLGCCVAHMSEANAQSTIRITFRMLENSNWETRHGGILGLKYALNVAKETYVKNILEDSFEPIFKCLGDPVDDVSAEAAASLVPVKDLMIEIIPDKTPKLINFLWEHLGSIDELTTSTSNIVLLLASLVTSSSAPLNSAELQSSIPRLWSLFGHSSTSVRVSVVKALITLIKAQETNCTSWMPEALLTTALRLVFQRSILENMDEVRPYLEEVWMLLVRIASHSQEVATQERFNLLKCTSKYLNYWLCLVMQPSSSAIDRGSPMWLKIEADGSESSIKPDGEVYLGSMTFNAETINQQKLQVTKCRLLSSKLLGALYANLVDDCADTSESQHFKDTLRYLSEMFVHYLKTKSANQKMISGWTIESWANHQIQLSHHPADKIVALLPKTLIDGLNVSIQDSSTFYDELASTFTRLQQETRDFVSNLRELGLNSNLSLAQLNDKRTVYNLAQIQSLCDLNLEVEFTRAFSKRFANEEPKAANHNHHSGQELESISKKRISLERSLRQTNSSLKALSTSVRSSIACAMISWRLMPDKIRLLVDTLLDSIELEDDISLQDKSIRYLVDLIDLLSCTDPSESPNKHNDLIDSTIDRLIDILSCKTLTSMFEFDDALLNMAQSSPRCSLDAGKRMSSDAYKIVLLDNLQRKAEQSRSVARRQSSANSTPSGSIKRLAPSSEQLESDNHEEFGKRSMVDGPASEVRIRGAKLCLSRLTEHFGNLLPQRLPRLWSTITSTMRKLIEEHKPSSDNQTKSLQSPTSEIQLIRSLRLLESVGKSIDEQLASHLLELYGDLISLLPLANPLIRHHSCQCIGIISKRLLIQTVNQITVGIIPMLYQSDDILARCGSIEAIALIIEHLQLELVPLIDMFIIHVLRRMSDQNDQVRLMATHCFGRLLGLMPLNLEKVGAGKLKQEQPAGTELKIDGPTRIEPADEGKFIEQLLDPKKLEPFVCPFEMSSELRSYQQDGLNWLAFLNRYNLHGILCDEMGLGKTLMTICMVASDHKIASTSDSLCVSSTEPSLIVCPPTLTGHWLYELDKFLPVDLRQALNPGVYSGRTLSERTNLRYKISNRKSEGTVNLVIASYDIVRNDIDFFKAINWNYCVLDEGHIIKNGRTKLSRAIRLLTARHRLILSGTPIQNNVTELWSLFDFLMPGFLGSERQFNSRFAKPILQSREPKCSARELEAGALAMESLHRQVLPFILRRLKEDVLDDLPPKIIQDYYCELSWLQTKLYEDFTRSKLCENITKPSIRGLTLDVDTPTTIQPKQEQPAADGQKSHVFQALQYLKNVCNHPKLVLSERHSQYHEIKRVLEQQKSSLDDITHSSKLKALRQLLIDCGIGPSSQAGDELGAINASAAGQQPVVGSEVESVINQHRALIFCQVRSMVSIVENDLLKRHLPCITYLKLDGSVPSSQRHAIVSRFNNDPSIDVLLLTTQIGGLGLNLTGADTVIFIEHDWNPTKDLQAMDRAHRIGQKKVVNVYRLITKGTLEEKIMGLQKFKTMVSNTVINQDNTGLMTMNADQLLNLFEDTPLQLSGSQTHGGHPTTTNQPASRKSSFIDLLPDLWDQQQYETEYDLSSFVASIKN